MPPGMLQQMQRQLRSGGGMQDMMKAMMQGQGGDQLDMEEMQSILFFPSCQFCPHCFRQG
jgi:signal recognition particle subunit SRP54